MLVAREGLKYLLPVGPLPRFAWQRPSAIRGRDNQINKSYYILLSTNESDYMP